MRKDIAGSRSRSNAEPLKTTAASLACTLVFSALALQGCAGGFSLGPLSNLFGKGEENRQAQAEPSVYYAGSAGLRICREPGGEPIGQLPLHAKVLRYRLEKGYAYVKVEETGQEGWVDNGRLIWRLPPPKAAASAPRTRPSKAHRETAPSETPESGQTNPSAPRTTVESPPGEESGGTETPREQPEPESAPAPVKSSSQPAAGSSQTPVPGVRGGGVLSPSIFNPY